MAVKTFFITTDIENATTAKTLFFSALNRLKLAKPFNEDGTVKQSTKEDFVGWRHPVEVEMNEYRTDSIAAYAIKTLSGRIKKPKTPRAFAESMPIWCTEAEMLLATSLGKPKLESDAAVAAWRAEPSEATFAAILVAKGISPAGAEAVAQAMIAKGKAREEALLAQVHETPEDLEAALLAMIGQED